MQDLLADYVTKLSNLSKKNVVNLLHYHAKQVQTLLMTALEKGNLRAFRHTLQSADLLQKLRYRLGYLGTAHGQFLHRKEFAVFSLFHNGFCRLFANTGHCGKGRNQFGFRYLEGGGV